MFGREKFQDGTGRDGKTNRNIVGYTRRDGMVGVKFLDGTGRHSTLDRFVHDGTGRLLNIITMGRDGN